MSLNSRQILEGLAMGQLGMVVPELGDNYAGRSAGLIAMLMLSVAAMHERMLDSAPELRARLEALLAQAANAGADTELALAAIPGEGWFARQDRLLAALETVHAWADRHDPALAGRCRDYLADLTAAKSVELPASG